MLYIFSILKFYGGHMAFPEIVQSVIDNNPEALAKCLASGVDINARTVTGSTALHWAAEQGSEMMVSRVLSYEADFRMVDETGWTALHAACLHGHLQCAMLLVSAGSAIDAQDAEGKTPLLCAVSQGFDDIAYMLLSHGADPTIARTQDRWTPLHAAVRGGKLALVQALRDHGAHVDALSVSEGFALQVVDLPENSMPQDLVLMIINMEEAQNFEAHISAQGNVPILFIFKMPNKMYTPR